MKLKIDITPNRETDTLIIDVWKTLNIPDDEWNDMGEQEQEDILNEYLCDMNEQPYWMVERWREWKRNKV